MLKPFTVSEIINEIKKNLEGAFFNITVEGEVSNLTQSATGHWYFSLSDEDSLISCALFKGDALRNSQLREIKNGDKIFCSGTISVYPKKGTFQLIAKKIFKSGKGDLKEQFELLKEKLRLEGLFDLETKKKLPQFPHKIVLITANESAALADFIEVLFRRTKNIELLIIPSLVQGDAAPVALIKAFKQALNVKNLDIIVFARGGGSMEDLWAFNHEELVRLVHQSQIPVVSAIGHQTDFTLLDFVADKRAETPTAAAELISQSYLDVEQELKINVNRLLSSFKMKFYEMEKRIEKVSPPKFLEKIWSRLNHYQKRLLKINIIDRQYEILRFPEKQLKLDDSIQRMISSLDIKMLQLKNRLEESQKLLKALNPKNVLERGFTIVSINEKVIVSKTQLLENKQSNIELQFRDGKVNASIIH